MSLQAPFHGKQLCSELKPENWNEDKTGLMEQPDNDVELVDFCASSTVAEQASDQVALESLAL